MDASIAGVNVTDASEVTGSLLRVPSVRGVFYCAAAPGSIDFNLSAVRQALSASFTWEGGDDTRRVSLGDSAQLAAARAGYAPFAVALGNSRGFQFFVLTDHGIAPCEPALERWAKRRLMADVVWTVLSRRFWLMLLPALAVLGAYWTLWGFGSSVSTLSLSGLAGQFISDAFGPRSAWWLAALAIATVQCWGLALYAMFLENWAGCQPLVNPAVKV